MSFALTVIGAVLFGVALIAAVGLLSFKAAKRNEALPQEESMIEAARSVGGGGYGSFDWDGPDCGGGDGD